MKDRTLIEKPPRRARRSLWLPALCAAALLAGAGCGGELDPECSGTGHIGLQLVWTIPDQPPSGLRMVLCGIIDTIRITVKRKGEQVAQTECTYDCEDEPSSAPPDPPCSCSLAEIRGCPEYEVVVEGLAGGVVLYRGTESDLTVKKDQTTPITVEMLPVYDEDIYPPAEIDDLEATFEPYESEYAIVLRWTAVGDACNLGKAAKYRILWSMDGPITEENLGGAHEVPGPAPDAAFAPQISPLKTPGAGATDWCRIKVKDDLEDDAGNESGLSNEDWVEIPIE